MESSRVEETKTPAKKTFSFSSEDGICGMYVKEYKSYYCPMYPLVTPMSSINAGTPTIPAIPMIAIGSFSGFVPAFSSGDKNASVFASFARVIFFGASP